MAEPRILIVGAGALGLLTGYHLALAGADITFLVRAARLPALQLPQRLYCYDDDQVKIFDRYQAIADVSELARQSFDHVLLTLDGAVCRTIEGHNLIAAIGTAIRDRDNTVIVGGVGVGDYVAATMMIPAERVVEGTLASLAYQTDRVTLPLHPPTDPSQLASANLAYRHLAKGSGFMLAGRPASRAEAFAALHDRSGVSKGVVLNADLFAIITTAFFPVTAICDLAGWPDTRTLCARSDLIKLCSAAMREIIGLPQHGWRGRIGAPFLRSSILRLVIRQMVSASSPLDFHAFNKFHHGGKVRDQDLGVMRDCLISGQSQGRKMTALAELLSRYERHCAEEKPRQPPELKPSGISHVCAAALWDKSMIDKPQA